MTPEIASYLDKARQCLANADTNLSVNLTNDAGRNAYLAVFHAAQAFILHHTAKSAKTHQGVQSEFNRLARNEPKIDKMLPAFLSQAYNLKAVADYETGPGSIVPMEKVRAAIETAKRFVDDLTALLA